MASHSTSILYVILSVVAVFVSAQTTSFTADVEIRHPLMTGGYVSATLSYSYDDRQYKLDYTGQNYFEVYHYNTQRGYAPLDETDKPFLDQWVYKWGATCTCETASVDAAMPQLFFDASSDLYDVAGDEMINGRSCTEYSKKATSPSDVTAIWIDAAGELCQFRFDDYREVSVVSYTPTPSFAAAVFTPPDGCKCGKPVDLVMVLDRSGSISPTEFIDQRGFVDGFSQNFNYGPYEAAFAIVHFNTPAWTTLSLREGTNPDNVVAGVGDLQCCNAPDHNSCCCCGTSISSGIRMGADEMATGRDDAAHILVVITDGYHNHDIYGVDCHDEGQGPRCRADLIDAVAYAKSQVPDIIIYAVGVGSDRDVAADELLIISDNHPERILRREDFAALANDNLELVARACQENVNPCGSCCGFCTCGECQPPDGCDTDTFCEEADVSGVCCKKSPKICPEDLSNKCLLPECDAINGECITVPVQCKADTECFTYTCEPTTGECQVQLLCGDVPQCDTAVDCSDNNDCTVDVCDPVEKLCKWEPLECPAPNQCETMECLPQGGCIATPVPENFCDDQNICTDDSCDPVDGCRNVELPCADDDPCTDDICDPFLGCRFTPKICPNVPAEDEDDEGCKVSFCEDGGCGFRDVSCPAAIAPEVIAGIGTAAVVGIIVGIVILLAALGGGGAYAYSQSAATGGVATVANNPIYVGSGSQGTNPLYQVG